MRCPLVVSLVVVTLWQVDLLSQENRIPPDVAVHRDLAYVDGGHERQRLDLYLPPGEDAKPLVIWIHGGAWRAGDKRNCPARVLLQHGFAVASINYRLTDAAAFPAQILDCRAAVRWLRERHEQFSLDPSRFGAWGSSAGGHLVALLGTSAEDSFDDVGRVSSRVQAVCDFYGPTDFLMMNRQALPEARLDHDAPNSPESLLVGGPLQEHPEVARQANPITYVSPDDPPFLIVHGDRDLLVPVQQSRLLQAALEAADVPSTLYEVRGGGHGRFQDPRVPELVEAFFRRHLMAAEN